MSVILLKINGKRFFFILKKLESYSFVLGVLFVCLFLAAMYGLWNLSSLTEG